MKIDCLMGTYGRYDLVCEALACFLQQSAIADATLLIYNQHPLPLVFEHPRVRIVNETGPAMALRQIRARMHELADPSADLLHWWDDDDLYLPWHLQDCFDHIGHNLAWRPAKAWFSPDNVDFSLQEATFEGSWVFRADYLKNTRIDTHPGYKDHPATLQTLEAGVLATTNLGELTSYIYRLDTGAAHLSAYGEHRDEEHEAEHIAMWRSHPSCGTSDGRLIPADLSQRWQQFLDGTRDRMTPDNWAFHQARLLFSSPTADQRQHGQ